MKDIFTLKDHVKGHLLIMGRYKGGDWFVLVDRKNNLVANAPELTVNALAGNSGWKIDSIDVYKSSVLLASSPTTFTFPSSNQVQFETLFSATSFNDTLDELRLSSIIGGDFSAVTGQSINKPNILELNIKWLLTIL